MHVLMLLAALSPGADVTIDPSSLTEPASQLEVALFEGNTRVKEAFSTATSFTLKPGAYRVMSGSLELARFKMTKDGAEVGAPLRTSGASLEFDRDALTRVQFDVAALASGGELSLQFSPSSLVVKKPVTAFLPRGEYKLGGYGTVSVTEKSKTVTFDVSKFTRVDFVVDELSSGGVTQVFTVKDVVKFENNATVFLPDDTFQLTRGTRSFGSFTTKNGRVTVTGGLTWDEASRSLRVDRKSLDRVSLDFTAFQRGMGSPDALMILDVQSTESSARLIGSGVAWLHRGTYSVSGLGSFATSPAPTTNGGVTWTVTADVSQLVPLKLTSKREFHVAPFTRSRSTWQLQLPRGRYALQAADGRALTTLVVEPPRASLESSNAGVTLAIE